MTSGGATPAADPAPWRMVSIKLSQGCEIARWTMDRGGVPYYEQVHAALVHAVPTLALGRTREVPVITNSQLIMRDMVGVLDNIDIACRPGRRVFGERDEERAANRAFWIHMLQLCSNAPRQTAYSALLPLKSLCYPLVTAGAPWWERMVVWWTYPLWRRVLAQGLGINVKAMRAAPHLVDDAAKVLEAELARRGTRFLCGAEPNSLDAAIAVLIAPLAWPPQYAGGLLPAVEALPPHLRDEVTTFRATRAGQYCLDVYALGR